MIIKISELMKSVFLRILDDEIGNQLIWHRQELDNGFPVDETRFKIIDECHKLINEIKMDGVEQ